MRILVYSLFILALSILILQVQSSPFQIQNQYQTTADQIGKPQLSKAQLDKQHKVVVEKLKNLFTPTYSDEQILSLMKQLYQQYLEYQWYQEHRQYKEFQTKFRKLFKATPSQCQELKELVVMFSQYFSKKISENIRNKQIGVYKQLENHFEKSCPQNPTFRPTDGKKAVVA
jgi:bisphosphoglycerate-dependent phosphoglycerate mutase